MHDDVDFESVLQSLAEQGGGLIEIFALNANYHGWRSVVEWLGRSALILPDDSDDRDSRIPRVTPEIFAVNGDVRATMFCKVGRQRWWTSFYSPYFIDFQGTPEQVETVNDIKDVVDFMKGLSRATGRSTALVAETTRPEKINPYIRVSAVGEME